MKKEKLQERLKDLKTEIPVFFLCLVAIFYMSLEILSGVDSSVYFVSTLRFGEATIGGWLYFLYPIFVIGSVMLLKTIVQTLKLWRKQRGKSFTDEDGEE